MTDTPITTPAEALEAAVDRWQAWLDDLPLREEFLPGIEELQEFLRALSARIAAPVAVVKPDRATFDAMCAMRDAINEYVPMPSLESDLIQGPENSVFCATVAEAVIAEIVRLRSSQPAAQAQAEAVSRLEEDVAHPDDAAVNKFAAMMKAKLALARSKGRSGWDDPEKCSTDYLAILLLGHINKGNEGTFVDIANFAMMLHLRAADPRVLAALNLPPEPQVQAEPVATVRPLVWPDFREGGTCGRPHQVQYFVTQDHDGNFWSLFDQQKFGSLAEAQANCEAHWQRTIVTTQPAAQVQAEAVAGAYLAVLREISGWDLASTAVEALTLADAAAALARRDAEVRKAALMEAAGCIDRYLGDTRVGPAAVVQAQEELALWLRHIILALIDKEPAQ